MEGGWGHIFWFESDTDNKSPPGKRKKKKKISVHEAGGNIVNLIIKLAARGLYIETQSEISKEEQKEKGETREDWE